MGGTGVFYTFRRAVFHEPQRATTTACPLACGGGRARAARPRRRARCASRGEALERAQGERRLAALDLDRPRPARPARRPGSSGGSAGCAARRRRRGGGRAGCAPGAWRRRPAGRCRRRPAGAAAPASRGRAAARRAGRRARGRPRPRSARARRRGARSAARTGGVRHPIQPATSSAPAGPNARRWRRTTSSSALSPFSAPRGRGAARRALGAFVPQLPSAGARTKADQRWNGRHLSSALALELGRRSRLGCSASHASTNAPISSRCAACGSRRSAASSAAPRPRRPARRRCAASGGPPPRRRPPRRPGARARTRGAASPAAACRRRALRPQRRVEGLGLEALHPRPQRRRRRRPVLRLQAPTASTASDRRQVEALEQALAREQRAVERRGRHALRRVAHAGTL